MAPRDSTMRPVAREEFIYEHRLAGFNATTGGKRTSIVGGGARGSKWPHKNPSAEQVARAGFIFDPNPEHPDNVTCYICTKALEGWCADDDPLREHLKHSEDCGWAVAAAIEAHLPEWEEKNPMSEELLEGRKKTFGEWWPYEKKKGWKCKVKQLAEAGWHFEPTFESDDMAKCAYCGLALDGWEAGDKPYDEHYRRAPHCKFFELCQRFPPVKKSRAKAASKASRLSTQSVATIATVASDLASAADITADHDDTVLTAVSTMTQGGKKGAKARKAPAKGRKTKAKKEETVEILEDEPQEPENLAPPPAKPGRGRKRASDAMEDSVVTNAEAPAPKKRATRAKGSAAVDTSIMTTASQDTEMVDAPAPKKAPAKKRATKGTRKTSQASVRSQPSTASLRVAAIDDEEIERQLQADLERPLTDDEDVAADSDSEKLKKPKPTSRGRPKKATGTRKASAQSQAPPSTDYQMFDPTPSEPNDADIEAEYQKMEAEVDAEKQELEEAPLVVPKKGRKAAGTRKASKQTKRTKELPPPPVDVDEDPLGDITPVPIHAPVRNEEELPEVDPDASTGTVVSQPIKRGRGRPSKKSLLALAAAEEVEKRRSSGLPMEVEVPLEPTRDQESFSVIGGTPQEIPRKPVPRPATSSSSVRPATSSSSARPPTSSSAAVPISTTPPTPARLDKALPPPPLESARRLPQPPATPRAAGKTPSANAKQATISPSQSPQSSDAENQPPSSKPTVDTPKRVVLAPVVSTPAAGSPSKRNVVAGLQSTTPWTAVDLDAVFSPGESSDKENGIDRLLRMGGELTSPEKRMTVEEWIYFNAEVAEEKFRHECEMIVSTFENEGSRAVRVLEGIIVD